MATLNRWKKARGRNRENWADRDLPNTWELEALALTPFSAIHLSLDLRAFIYYAFNTSCPTLFSGRNLVAEIFGMKNVEEYAERDCSLCTEQFDVNDSATAKLHELLKKSRRGSVLNKLAQCYLVTCPHSMITERAVKHHTILTAGLRSSMSRSTVSQRLLIALNGPGTANYDPSPAVCKFLGTKNRRAIVTWVYINNPTSSKPSSKHGCNLVGDTEDVSLHFLRWGDIICHVPPLFLFRFRIWRDSTNESDVWHVLREVLFVLNVTHSQVDDETEFKISLDSCVVSLSVISLDSFSLSISASIKWYLAFFKFLETAKDGLLLLSDFLSPRCRSTLIFGGAKNFCPNFRKLARKKFERTWPPKRTSSLSFWVPFCKINEHTPILRMFAHILPKFPHVLPGF